MIVPEEIIYEIAKYCSAKTILSLTRISHKFVSVFIKDEITLSRNKLWRVAMTQQFPTKKYHSFWSDDVNYFVANTNKFAIIYDYDNDRISSMFKNDEITTDILFGFVNEMCDIIKIKSIDDRYLIKCGHSIKYINFIEKINIDYEFELGIDLKFIKIMFGKGIQYDNNPKNKYQQRLIFTQNVL